MHNSQDGALVDTANPNGNAYLLNNGNATDTCLQCHAGYGQFADGAGFGPGGDFAWVTKTFTWSAHGHTSTSEGDSHGHNVISPAYGIAQDATLTTAPGGDFQAQYLRCTSCHDPHGNQNFRLLYSNGTGPVYNGGNYAFSAPAPVALGNSRNTLTDAGKETDLHHTVYKSGMSDWCANCHTNFHSDNTTNFVHPIGELGSTVAATYNAYVSSDNLTGGTAATAYMGLVPFEAVNADLGLVAWKEQNLLMAHRPATDFGFRRPVAVQRAAAANWLRAAPADRWVLSQRNALGDCVDEAKTVDLGEANRRDWLLYRANALRSNADCRD